MDHSKRDNHSNSRTRTPHESIYHKGWGSPPGEDLKAKKSKVVLGEGRKGRKGSGR